MIIFVSTFQVSTAAHKLCNDALSVPVGPECSLILLKNSKYISVMCNFFLLPCMISCRYSERKREG